MKHLIFLIQCLFISSISFSQYSDFYNINRNKHDINVSGTVNQNINQNVNVSGNVRQTITTIDYGALANANALKESNRITQQNLAIEQARYRDEKERNNAILDAQRALEIALDPLKAHQYGTYYSFNSDHTNDNDSWIKNRGFLSYSTSCTVPHTSLFQNIGQGRFENISTDGITTEIIRNPPYYDYRNLPSMNSEQIDERNAWYERLSEYYRNNDKPSRRDYKQDKEGFKKDLARYLEICDSLDNSYFTLDYKESVRNFHITEGEMFPSNTSGDSAYCHKKELVKRTVYGVTGFRSTLIWEDEFEIGITDNYSALDSKGIKYFGKVRYKADKNSVITFQELEGRRFYLSKYIDKFHAGSKVYDAVTRPIDKYFPKRRSYSSSIEHDEAVKKYFGY